MLGLKLNHVSKEGPDHYCSVRNCRVAYFTEEINSSLAIPPLNFNGGLAKLGLTSSMSETIGTKAY